MREAFVPAVHVPTFDDPPVFRNQWFQRLLLTARELQISFLRSARVGRSQRLTHFRTGSITLR
jgi:hypothetical protein